MHNSSRGWAGSIGTLFILSAFASSASAFDLAGVIKQVQQVARPQQAPAPVVPQAVAIQSEVQAPLQKEVGSAGHSVSKGVYIKDQNNCKVWVPEADQGESVTWTGKCIDGYAEGGGAIVWLVNGKPTGDRGELALRAGKANGKGTLVFADGSSYSGGFVDGVRSGVGVTATPGKPLCHSDWRNDEPVSGCLSPTQIAVQQKQERLNENRQQQVESQKLQSPTDEKQAGDPQAALTKLPLELKGLVLGMSVEQLVKIYPQTQFTKTLPNTQQWLLADSIGKIENRPSSYNGKSVSISVMGQEPRLCITAFIQNKLVYAEVVLWSGESDDIGVRSSLFKDLVSGFGERLQVQAKIKTETNGRSYVQGGSDRTLEKAIWKSSAQDTLSIADDSFYSDKSQSILTVQLVAANYEATKKARLNIAQAAIAKQNAQQEGARKSDF